MQAVSVIVPTYNEFGAVNDLVPAIKAALDGRIEYELIIADDNSPDGTGRESLRLGKEHCVPVRVVMQPAGRSLSRSVIAGAHSAEHGCVVVMDADLSHDPGEIVSLAREVLEGRADVAVASRYYGHGEVVNWPRRRRLESALATRLARLVAPIRDPLSGYFACRRDLLTETVELHPRGYKILLELLSRVPGLRVVELPTRFRDRTVGRSKLRLRQKTEFLVQVLSLLRVRMKRARNSSVTSHIGVKRAIV